MLERWTDETEADEIAAVRDVLIAIVDEAGCGPMFATLTLALDDVRETLIEKMADLDDDVRQIRESGGEPSEQLAKSTAPQLYAIARLKALVTALTTETDRMMRQEGAQGT